MRGVKPPLDSSDLKIFVICLKILMASHISLSQLKLMHSKIRRLLTFLVESFILLHLQILEHFIRLEEILVDNLDSIKKV